MLNYRPIFYYASTYEYLKRLSTWPYGRFLVATDLTDLSKKKLEYKPCERKEFGIRVKVDLSRKPEKGKYLPRIIYGACHTHVPAILPMEEDTVNDEVDITHRLSTQYDDYPIPTKYGTISNKRRANVILINPVSKRSCNDNDHKAEIEDLYKLTSLAAGASEEKKQLDLDDSNQVISPNQMQEEKQQKQLKYFSEIDVANAQKRVTEIVEKKLITEKDYIELVLLLDESSVKQVMNDVEFGDNQTRRDERVNLAMHISKYDRTLFKVMQKAYSIKNLVGNFYNVDDFYYASRMYQNTKNDLKEEENEKHIMRTVHYDYFVEQVCLILYPDKYEYKQTPKPAESLDQSCLATEMALHKNQIDIQGSDAVFRTDVIVREQNTYVIIPNSLNTYLFVHIDESIYYLEGSLMKETKTFEAVNNEVTTINMVNYYMPDKTYKDQPQFTRVDWLYSKEILDLKHK